MSKLCLGRHREEYGRVALTLVRPELLYKYIVSTPLTFPEYVTPHARDLLKRILVPDPRKRADLFEVARHSWLSEYAHVVGFITSSTTTSSDIANTTVPAGKWFMRSCARTP